MTQGIEVELTDYEFMLCEAFSQECAPRQQAIEFGEGSTAERDRKERERDILIGKMGEIGVSKVLSQKYGIQSPVNLNVYPKYVCDDFDLVINGWNAEVKTTRDTGWHLMITREKVEKWRKDNKLPDVIISCKAPWDRVTDKPAKHAINIIGCISMGRFLEGWNCQRVQKGQTIPGTNTRAQADNYVIDDKYLCEFEKAVNGMINVKKGGRA